MRKSRLFAAAAPLALLGSVALAEDQTVTQSFQAKRVQIDALAGNLKVIVARDKPSIDVTLSGSSEMIQKIRLSTSGDAMVMSMDGVEGDWWDDMWDWSSVSPEDLNVTITVATGTPVRVDNYIGDADIGDIEAALKMNTSGGQVRAGRLEPSGRGGVDPRGLLGDEPVQIATAGSHVEPITGSRFDQHRRCFPLATAQQSTQVGHMRVDGGAGRGHRFTVPDRVDQ